MMPSSRLDCPLSLKTPNMGNPGFSSYAYSLNLNTKVLDFVQFGGAAVIMAWREGPHPIMIAHVL